MRITTTPEIIAKHKENERIANLGCEVCPTCGGASRRRGVFKQWCTGVFKHKFWKVNLYYCDKCGTEYESDPYEYYVEG